MNVNQKVPTTVNKYVTIRLGVIFVLVEMVSDCQIPLIVQILMNVPQIEQTIANKFAITRLEATIVLAYKASVH